MGKSNWSSIISPFEINFFFAIVGLMTSFAYNFFLSDNYVEMKELAASTEANPDELLMPLMALTGVLTVVLTISILAVVMLAGPTMVNIIGTMKDVILTYLALFYFIAPDQTECCDVVFLVGLGISFIGAADSIKTQASLVI